MLARPTAAAAKPARALLVTVLIATLLGGCASGSSSSSSRGSAASVPLGSTGFDGAALPPGVRARSFTLVDQSGRRVSWSSYRGQVTIVAFVYSTCGATCVVIAQQIRGALDELGRPVPVLLISADPQADTPANVRRFLSRVSLGGRVSYLSGSPAQLQPVWRAFHVTAASADRAAFARTAPVYLIDRAGNERVIYQLEQLTPEALAHDVRKLLA